MYFVGYILTAVLIFGAFFWFVLDGDDILASLFDRTPLDPSSWAARACNFDCYDDGGCHLCSTYVEEHDPDYGIIGYWRRDDDDTMECGCSSGSCYCDGPDSHDDAEWEDTWRDMMAMWNGDPQVCRMAGCNRYTHDPFNEEVAFCLNHDNEVRAECGLPPIGI